MPASLPGSDIPEVVPAVYQPEAPSGIDDVVRAALGGLADHPRLAGWLVADDLATRIVRVVDAVAGGAVPPAARAACRDGGDFLVYEQDDRLLIAAGTARRYDALVGQALAVDPYAVTGLLASLEPQLDAAWAEQGGDGPFEARVRLAVEHLLAFEPPSEPIEVERHSRCYEWADDGLRALSPAQKAMLRMGPRHTRRLQAHLAEVRDVFGWTPPASIATAPILTADAEPILDEMVAPDGAASVDTEEVTVADP
jgi:hypothetical protein